jgi:enoyl-CoA hydratase
MTENYVRIEKKTSFTKWTIDRPQRGNGLGPSIAKELTSHLKEYIKESPKNHALVISAAPISGKDRKIWIAGGDLKELSSLTTAKEAFTFSKSMIQFLDNLSLLPIPVIMMIDGDAIGGGAEFALGGDIRIATSTSRFEFKQLKMGLPTGFGGTRRLSQILSLTQAETLIYGSQTLDATEAHSLGLLHGVTPTSEALQQLTEEWVDRLVSIDPQAFAAQKTLFRIARDTRSAAVDQESQLFSQAWNNPSHREQIKAFLSKSAENKLTHIPKD